MLAPYGMQFDEAAVVSLNGSPTWHMSIDPHQLAREKTAALHNILFDAVTALRLIDVVKRYHGKRPMAVRIGSERAMTEALLRHPMLAVINPIRKPSMALNELESLC